MARMGPAPRGCAGSWSPQRRRWRGRESLTPWEIIFGGEYNSAGKILCQQINSRKIRSFKYFHTGVRYVYKTSFDLPESESFMGRAWGLHQEQIPSWQKFILTTAMPVLKAYVSKFADTSPEQVQKAKDDIKKTMKEVRRNAVYFSRRVAYSPNMKSEINNWEKKVET